MTKKELYNYYVVENHTRVETATFFNLSTKQLQRQLEKYQIKKPKDYRKTRIDKRKILVDYDTVYDLFITQNLSVPEVAEKLNINRVTLQKRLGELKIKKPFYLRTEMIRKNGGFNFGDKRREKIKATCQRKYGVDNPGQAKQFKEKRLNTFRTRYGVDNASQMEGNRAKVKKTNLERYGVNDYNQKHISSLTLEILSSKEKLTEYLKKGHKKTFTELSKELGISYCLIENYVHQWELLELIDYKPGESTEEKQIARLIRSWKIKVKSRDRSVLSKYELDMYFPNNNFAIEYNGNYWHSSKFKSMFYHQRKSLECAKHEIQLFHIFEYEWLNERKRPILIDMLQNYLNINRTTIYACDCSVCEIDNKIKSDFLNSYHLKGDDNSSVCYGLYHENILMSVMTFSPSRNHDWELSRYACKTGYIIVGGASKLFKKFICAHKGTIVAYSDLAKESGEVYKELGFEFEYYTQPKYVWCDKHTNETKEQNDNKSKCFKIYDCGKKVWSYKNN